MYYFKKVHVAFMVRKGTYIYVDHNLKGLSCMLNLLNMQSLSHVIYSGA